MNVPAMSRQVQRLALLLFALIIVFSTITPGLAQAVNPGLTPAALPIAFVQPRFKTWRTSSGFKRPTYPIVFVASYRDTSFGNGGNFGTDVLQVGVPQAGQELWILLTNGATKKIFPIAGVHDAVVDDSIIPVNGRIIGAVTEPSISIDGKRVIFTYFHNAQDLPAGCCGNVNHSNFEGWQKGGDLYVIDLQAVLNNPSVPVSTLPFSRLTQTLAGEQHHHAMNPGLSSTITVPFPAGVVYTGGLEIDSAYGRQLLFTSSRRQLANSNIQVTRKNKNFNLFTGDIAMDNGQYLLDDIKQAQYFTTTSAISPNRLRVGYAFTYQANTEDGRQWHIQQVIGHKWAPLYGYGIGNELAHLASFCVKSSNSPPLPAGDYEVATRYYNLNNNGFGAIFAQPMAQAGLNTYNNPVTYGKVPRQVGSVKITKNVPSGDVNSSNGKFTTPNCAGPDELYLAYDPGPSNHRFPNAHNYNPKIVFTDLEPADPATSPGAYQNVIVASTTQWAALWPKPVVDWNYRLTGTADPNGNAQQELPSSPIDAGFTEPLATPYAMVGTSALYNTDVMPVDCRVYNHYYNPNVSGDGIVDNMYNNIANLSRVFDDGNPTDVSLQQGFCTQPGIDDVFGIAIYMTSNRISQDTLVITKRGYTTDNSSGSAVKETKRLLGVYEIGSVPGIDDASFKAIVPANEPIEFHLLDENGLKLADVRSWHSLKPRESRVDCGGCHNHRVGAGIPWSGSDAANSLIPAEDMVRETKQVQYDAFCRPGVVTTSLPVVDVPVWQDLSNSFDTHCGSCHEQNSNDQPALNAFDYQQAQLTAFNNDGSPQPGNPLKQLFARNYIDRYGANGSPMFWAAYGARTDGRDNAMAEYQPDQPDFSTCSDTDPEKCGYYFGSVHAALPLCDGSSVNAANWVYQLSQWIDNHAPVDQPGKPYNYQYDRYHPTVEGAFVPTGNDCGINPTSFDIGFWDDSGSIVELDIDLNGSDYMNVTNPGQLNNDQVYSLPLHGINVSNISHFLLKVTVTDAAGNRQIYEKAIAELIAECQATL